MTTTPQDLWRWPTKSGVLDGIGPWQSSSAACGLRTAHKFGKFADIPDSLFPGSDYPVFDEPFTLLVPENGEGLSLTKQAPHLFFVKLQFVKSPSSILVFDKTPAMMNLVTKAKSHRLYYPYVIAEGTPLPTPFTLIFGASDHIMLTWTEPVQAKLHGDFKVEINNMSALFEPRPYLLMIGGADVFPTWFKSYRLGDVVLNSLRDMERYGSEAQHWHVWELCDMAHNTLDRLAFVQNDVYDALKDFETYWDLHSDDEIVDSGVWHEVRDRLTLALEAIPIVVTNADTLVALYYNKTMPSYTGEQWAYMCTRETMPEDHGFPIDLLTQGLVIEGIAGSVLITIRDNGCDCSAFYEYIQAHPEALLRFTKMMKPQVHIDDLTLYAISGRRGKIRRAPAIGLGHPIVAMCDVDDARMTGFYTKHVAKALEVLRNEIWGQPGRFRIWYLGDGPFKIEFTTFAASGDNDLETQGWWAQEFVKLLQPVAPGISMDVVPVYEFSLQGQDKKVTSYAVQIESHVPMLMFVASNETLIRLLLSWSPRIFGRVNINFVPIPRVFVEVKIADAVVRELNW